MKRQRIVGICFTKIIWTNGRYTALETTNDIQDMLSKREIIDPQLHQFKIACTMSSLPRIKLEDLLSNTTASKSSLFDSVTRHAFAIVSLSSDDAELLNETSQMALQFFETVPIEGFYSFYK